jgi:hypothetical protein
MKCRALIDLQCRESVREYSRSCMDMRRHEALNSADPGVAARQVTGRLPDVPHLADLCRGSVAGSD